MAPQDNRKLRKPGHKVLLLTDVCVRYIHMLSNRGKAGTLVTVSFERSESVIFLVPLGSEVWHPICKQAARAEKKLKVRGMVFHATFSHRLGKLCFHAESTS